ncbi:MAG TPA: hypothetical protein VLA13_07680 [Massilibacterium sp.]|nr:hypothetical protein [Massilibacterium sp.]
MIKHPKDLFKPVDVPDKDLDDFIIKGKSFWKDKPLGRTLSLRNKMGKTIAGIGLGALATFTGIDLTHLIEPTLNIGIMEDLSLIQIIITVIAMAVTFGLGYFKVSPNLKGKLDVLVEYVADELVKATDSKSEQGQKITRNEIVQIVKGIVNRVFK